MGDKKEIAFSLNNIIETLNGQGQAIEVLDYLSRSIKKREEEILSKSDMAISLNNIGALYNSRGQLKEALTYYGRSLKISQEIGDKNGIASSLNNIGVIYPVSLCLILPFIIILSFRARKSCYII